ncbi:MAG TPA: CBS domain-containing protein [Candidatus Nanoarchaeia archaeon]|nr:CBS domain-containing protein [Candidatus Nanoarchaeia archaeon]
MDAVVGDVLSREYDAVDENDFLAKAIEKFKGKRKPPVLVVLDSDGKYRGILVEKQIIRARLDTARTKIKQIMTKTPKFNTGTSLVEASKYMVELNIKSLPVFKHDKLVGIVSDDAILKIIEKNLGDQPIGKYMSRNPKTVDHNETIGAVHKIFRDHHISRVPVLKNNRLFGIITQHDIITKTGFKRESQTEGETSGESVDVFKNPISGLVTSSLITASAEETVRSVIGKMAKFRISGIPVIDAKGNLVGIVTKTDLLEPIASQVKKTRRFSINATGDLKKLSGFDKAEVNDLLNRFVSRYENEYSEGYLFIRLKEHREQLRRLPRYYCNARFVTDHGTFLSSDHGFGAEQAVKNALDLLVRQIEEHNMKLTKQNRARKRIV